MARGGAESPRSQETETSSQSLDPQSLRPNLTLSWRCQGHFSQDHQELLTDRPSSKEPTSNHGGIPRGHKERNSFLEPVPEDVGPRNEQGHGNWADVPRNLPGVTGATSLEGWGGDPGEARALPCADMYVRLWGGCKAPSPTCWSSK